MRFNDAITGAAFTCFAVLVLLYAQTFPPPGHQPIGPAFFPSLIAILMMLAGGVLMVRGVRDYVAERSLFKGAPWTSSPSAWLRILMIPAAVIGYLLLSPYIGFMAAAALAVVALALQLRRPLVVALALGVVSAIVIYVVFTRLFLVPLPVGPLEALFR
jgi:putative tricarboxylic transport membrane protein